ncbi:MAG: hypothetical protein WDO12_03200 [Pseudomonadota bacterium]
MKFAGTRSDSAARLNMFSASCGYLAMNLNLETAGAAAAAPMADSISRWKVSTGVLRYLMVFPMKSENTEASSWPS